MFLLLLLTSGVTGMHTKQHMDRGIRIMGGCILIYLSFVGGELYSPGMLAAIIVGLYGLLTGIINFCPLSLFILQEKKIKRGKASAEKAIKAGDVKALYFFSDFSDDEIDKVLFQCLLKSCPRDYHVVEEGKHKKNLYIIYSGEFKIVKAISEGETKIVGTMADGEAFGEQSFFCDLPPSVSVVAMEDAKVLEIDEIHFHEMIGKDPDLGIKILCRLMKLTCARMSLLHEQIASIGNMVVQGRLHHRDMMK